MLVLSRKSSQQILIGPNITITVVRVKGDTVRLGIDAPADVCVLRTELVAKLAASARPPASPRLAVRLTPRTAGARPENPGEQSPPQSAPTAAADPGRAPRAELAPHVTSPQHAGPAPLERFLKVSSR